MYYCNNYATCCKRLGSQNALCTLLTLDLYFRGPEDDSERVETCRPKIAFYVIKLLYLTDTLYFIHSEFYFSYVLYSFTRQKYLTPSDTILPVCYIVVSKV